MMTPSTMRKAAVVMISAAIAVFLIPVRCLSRFLSSSIMEEANASSQIEGASTTRKVAKDMLRRNRSPRNKAEQMIHNNYAAIQYITENKEGPLTLGDLPRGACRPLTEDEITQLDNP